VYATRFFNSLREAWVDAPGTEAKKLEQGIAIQLDGKGFCVIELRQEL